MHSPGAAPLESCSLSGLNAHGVGEAASGVGMQGCVMWACVKCTVASITTVSFEA